MGLIPQEKLLEVQQSSDIVEVVGNYVALKKAGSTFKGLCPFHTEKTPSFVVWPQRQIFKCFGCGAKGNVLGFVQQIEKVGFAEAVKMLADRAGIKLQTRQTDSESDKRKTALYSLMQWTAQRFNAALKRKEGAHTLGYVKQRGISEDSIDRFGIGYAPGGWDWLFNAALKEGYTPEQMEQAGLIVAKDHGGYRDKFVNRVMFPICDVRGKVIAFGGRVLEKDAQPKYLNSPETEIYHKRDVLYALHLAKQSISRDNRAVIVEGYTDVILAHQYGQDYVVATLGTALTKQQAALLRRFGEDIVLVFDSDKAGLSATDRGLEVFFEEDIAVKVASVPSGKDPCDYVVEHGGEAFKQVIDQAQDFIEMKIARARDAGVFESASDRGKVVRDMVSLVAKLRDPIRADLYVREIASASGASVESLKAELTRSKRQERPTSVEPGREETRRTLTPMDKAERGLLSLAITRSDMLEVIRELYPLESFHNADYAAIFNQLLQLTNLRRNTSATAAQLSALVQDERLAELIFELEHEAQAVTQDANRFMEDCLDMIEDADRVKHKIPLAKAQLARHRGTEHEDAMLAKLHQDLASRNVHKSK